MTHTQTIPHPPTLPTAEPRTPSGRACLPWASGLPLPFTPPTVRTTQEARCPFDALLVARIVGDAARDAERYVRTWSSHAVGE